MKTEISEVDGIKVYTNIYEEADFATADQKSGWLAVCATCEHKQEDRCGGCGCLLESVMNLATAKCPLNKW
jgi:hypothetical protein